eukprot:765309-Hanusia_phi.AAC.8
MPILGSRSRVLSLPPFLTFLRSFLALIFLSLTSCLPPPLPPSKLSASASNFSSIHIELPPSYSPPYTWGQSRFMNCSLNMTWEDILASLSKSQAYTGGLGILMTADVESWVCIEHRECALDVADPLFCWVYAEINGSFIPWGENQDLQLVSKRDFSCPPGSFLDLNTQKCLSCPPGTFSKQDTYGADSLRGSTTCSSCTAGTYGPGIGLTSCLDCPPSSQSPPESTVVTQCTCQGGYMQGLSSCVICQPGETLYNLTTYLSEAYRLPDYNSGQVVQNNRILLGTKNFTISMWATPSASAQSSMASDDRANYGTYQFRLMTLTSMRVSLFVTSIPSQPGHSGSPEADTSGWRSPAVSLIPLPLHAVTHVLLIRDGYWYRLYFNGTQQFSVQADFIADLSAISDSNIAYFRIGSRFPAYGSSADLPFQGSIDDAFVIERALDDDEIASIPEWYKSNGYFCA